MRNWAYYVGGIILGYWLYRKYVSTNELLFTQINGDTELDQPEPTFFESSLEFLQPDLESENVTIEQYRQAFLNMLKVSEGVGFGYYTLYGNTNWGGDLHTHPALQGWPGVPLPDEWCKNAGIGAPCRSYAAGAYQITRGTFLRLQRRLGTTDFSPATQDAMALELIREKGALDLIDNGQIVEAAAKVSSIWASLPGSTSGQPQHNVDFIVQTFNNFLTG